MSINYINNFDIDRYVKLDDETVEILTKKGE